MFRSYSQCSDSSVMLPATPPDFRSTFLHRIPCLKCRYVPRDSEGSVVPPSPIPHLLGTNLALSDTEAIAASAALGVARQNMLSLKQAIWYVDALFAKLSRRQKRLEQYVAGQQKILRNLSLPNRVLRVLGWDKVKTLAACKEAGEKRVLADDESQSSWTASQDDGDDELSEDLRLLLASFDNPCEQCGFLYQFAEMEACMEVPPSLELGMSQHARAIRETLARAERKRQRLDKDVKRVALFLDQLKNEIPGLNNFIAAHGACLAPVRRMPPELWAEIFLLCADNEPSDVVYLKDVPNTFDVKRVPLVFMHVCKAWRELAASIPKLWTTVLLDTDRPPADELMKCWLARSQSLPLTVSISQKQKNRDAPPALQLLAAQSSRWQTASLRIPKHSNLWTPLSSVRGRLASLERLCLQTQEPIQHDIFSDAPKLAEIALDCYHSVRLPYKQLSTLHFLGTVEDFLSILQASPALTNCDIDVLPSSSIGTSSAAIKHPNLKVLNITARSSSWNGVKVGIDGLFDKLFLPSLTHFALVCDPGVPKVPSYPLVHFLKTCGCFLQYLEIKSASIAGWEIVAFLIDTPRLVTLNLDVSFNATDEVLKSLCWKHQAPDLQALIIQCESPTIPQCVLACLHTRLPVVDKYNFEPESKLQLVVLTLKEGPAGARPLDLSEDDPILDKLDELGHKGLRIQIYTRKSNVDGDYSDIDPRAYDLRHDTAWAGSVSDL